MHSVLIATFTAVNQQHHKLHVIYLAIGKIAMTCTRKLDDKILCITVLAAGVVQY